MPYIYIQPHIHQSTRFVLCWTSEEINTEKKQSNFHLLNPIFFFHPYFCVFFVFVWFPTSPRRHGLAEVLWTTSNDPIIVKTKVCFVLWLLHAPPHNPDLIHTYWQTLWPNRMCIELGRSALSEAKATFKSAPIIAFFQPCFFTGQDPRGRRRPVSVGADAIWRRHVPVRGRE